MGFPAGMQLATIAFGIPLTATGKEVLTKVRVRPTSRVIWAATGQPLPEFEDSFMAEAGQLGQFQVPFVDQPGFIDSAGNAVTDWAYRIDASWEFGNERPIKWEKNLKPLLGQTGPIDLDLVPDGPVSIPVTAPTAAVLGFNGRTGFITLTDADLPARLSAEELSATILTATGKPTRAQAPGTLVANATDDGGRTACWMDATRTRIFAAYRNILRYTDDDGATWIDVPGLKISKDIIAVRDLDNGEVLISSGGVGTQAELWVSTGFRANPQTATWRKTKTAAAAGVYFSNSWSFSVHKNIVLVNEYGPKPGGAGNARYCYMSLDYGQTWKTIYDLGTGTGNHLHGVCYDPYWDRIWITYGDDTSAIVYSDNLGANWSVAQSTTVAAGDFQAVGILAMPTCVLFASDGQPNGVLRIPRSAGKAAGAYTPEVAYRLDNATSLTWLGHLPFRAQRAGDDAPALFPFAPELSTGKSRVLATVDGVNFSVIWEDTIDTTSRGAITALGPTARGKLWIVSSDGRQANYSKWVGTMPVGY